MSTSVLDWYHRYLDPLGGCQGHHPLAERLGSLVPRPIHLFGFAFRSLAGIAFFAAITSGMLPTSGTGSKFFRRSYGSRYSTPFVTCVDNWPTLSV